MPSLRWAVGGLLLVGILTRLLGLAREIIVAGYFGTSPDLDGVYLGLAVPMALCIGIGGGVGRAVVPIGAALATNQVYPFLKLAVRRMAAIVGLPSAVIAATSPLWAVMLIPADSPVPIEAVIWASALGSLGILGAALSGLTMGMANARGRHVTSAFAHFSYNVIIIISLLALQNRIGAYALLVGILLAEWGQVLVIGPFLKEFANRFGEVSPSLVSELQWLFWPSAGMAVASGLNRAVDRFFAAMLEEGSVSALAYADRLLFLPTTLLGMALAQPLYTRLSHFAARKEQRGFEQTLELGVRLMLLAGVPMGLLVSGLAEGLISLVLERGAFSPADTLRSAGALRGYGIAIVFYAMTPMVISAGMAKRQAWSLLVVFLCSLPLNAFLDWYLVGKFGLLGVALATSVLSGIVMIVMLWQVSPALLRCRSLWRAALRGSLLGIAGAVGLFAFRFFWEFPVGEGFLRTLLWTASGAAASLLSALLIAGFPALAEWRSLSRLRIRVAGYAGLVPEEPTTEDSPIPTDTPTEGD